MSATIHYIHCRPELPPEVEYLCAEWAAVVRAILSRRAEGRQAA